MVFLNFMTFQDQGAPCLGHLTVHRFCMCGINALSGDLLGVSRCMECEFLLVLILRLQVFLSISCTVSSFIRDIILCYFSFAFSVFVVSV